MSLTISISTPYGIVLAADSRQTTTIFAQGIQIPRIGSDSATKIFNVPGRPIGITAAGPAFLPDPSNPHGAQRSIGSIIGDYLSGLETTKTVEEVHNGLVDYLEGVYTKPQVKMMEAQLLSSLPQGTKLGKTEQQEGSNEMIIRFTTPDDKNGEAHAQLMPISIIVTGYDKEAEDKFLGKTFVSHVPGGNTVKRAAASDNEYGCSWTGQSELVTRVIKGFDPRIGVIPSLRQLGQQVGEGTLKAELDMLEYQINWGAMTLHDAIKLAKLLIDTTAAMQSFSIGTGFGPDAPGVGGPVDIAVILPEEKGFRWQQSKALSLTAAEEVIQ